MGGRFLKKKSVRYSPTICVTHRCNLDCVYCYQKHDGNSDMTFEVAQKCIDWIFSNIPDYAKDGVEVGFIGGEPLLQFQLLTDIYDYTMEKYPNTQKIFYATTNGSLLTEEMKVWFFEHKETFILGLSLDGARDTHNHNRSNSFDLIDFDFFRNTWPNQGVKMTLSDYSLPRLAENIKFVHSLGFSKINGVNLAEGDFDWNREEYVKVLEEQLQEIVEYYVENDDIQLNQMLDKKIFMCESKKKEKKKWCGIGTGTTFFDIDGKRYPCPFVTPMTFDEDDIKALVNDVDYSKDEDFVDKDCFDNCYIYPLCSICYGANYLNSKKLNVRDKGKCRIQKLIALFSADVQAKRILKNKTKYDDKELYYTIEAIKKIREKYLEEFPELK